MIGRRDCLIDQECSRTLGKSVVHRSSSIFMTGLEFKESLDRIGLLIVIDDCVMCPAHEYEVREGVPLDIGLLIIVTGAARPCRLDVTDFANHRLPLD